MFRELHAMCRSPGLLRFISLQHLVRTLEEVETQAWVARWVLAWPGAPDDLVRPFTVHSPQQCFSLYSFSLYSALIPQG